MISLFAASPWAWKPHPEVWLLVGTIVVLGYWTVRMVGPKVVPVGYPITTVRQRRTFVLAALLLLVAADWPVHDIAEDHLYSVHMVQHLLITFVVPPLFLLSVPGWLVRLLFLEGGFGSRILKRLVHPVVAGGVFNALVALTHWSAVVRFSSESGVFHYLVHVGLFSSALLMWMPVVSPLRELRLPLPGQMIYLFLMSVIPTIPAAWLTFAEGTVYGNYDDGYELWSISVRSDQQAAGLIMKLFGGLYLWMIIVVKFFTFSQQHRSLRQTQHMMPVKVPKVKVFEEQ